MCENKHKAFRRFTKNYMTSQTLKASLVDKINERLRGMVDQAKLDNCYGELLYDLRAEMTKHAKISKRKHTPFKPYWTDRLSTLWKKYNECTKRLKMKNQAHGRIVKEYRTARYTFDKELRKAKRQYDRGLSIEIDSVSRKNPRKFWEELNKLGPRVKNRAVCEAKDHNGAITRDPEKVTDHWFQCFKNQGNKRPEGNFDETFYKECKLELRKMMGTLKDSDEGPNELNGYIRQDEVVKNVMKGKKGKAVGVDRITYESLQNDTCINILHRLYNKCFELSMIPTEWRSAVVLPISKGSKSVSTEPLTFRGISLQCCIYKIYSGILNDRVYNFMENNNMLSNCQNGFRRNRSCMDHIYTVTDLIKMKIANGQKVFSMFVDYKSAFDLVDHDLMLYSLCKMGVNGKMIRAYAEIYRAPRCAVNVNGQLTDFFESVVGTRQGDNSSPNLFNCFLQSLLSELEESNLGVTLTNGERISVLAYADDILLLAENSEDLQRLSDIVYRWSRRWRMLVNIDKTKVVIFRGKRITAPECVIRYGNEIVEVVEGYRYLGVHLDQNLTFSNYAEQISSAGGRALGAMINKCRTLKDMGYQTYTKLYFSGVASVLDYGSEIVNLNKQGVKQKESVQYRAGRYFLGTGQHTALCSINAEMGWRSCQSRSDISRYRFYNRIVKMPDERLPKKVFLACKNISGTWANELYHWIK